MELIGQIKAKFDTQVVSDRFKKREIVIATELSSPYPQYIPCQLTQDKCDLADSFNVGDEVKAHINLRGREWSGPEGVKYFVTIEIWRLEKIN